MRINRMSLSCRLLVKEDLRRTTKPNERMQVNDTTSSVELDSIDDFLPMPGADSVVTGDEEAKPGIFTNPKAADLSFLDKDDDDKGSDKNDNPDPNKDQEVIDTLKELDDELLKDDEDSDDSAKASNKGRKRIDKSGMVETFSKLIEEGVLVGFDDEKPMEEYSLKDWKELIQANLEEREKAIREQTPQEFFESLPTELQYAAEYVAKGGSDMKGLFRALAQVEEVRSMDPSQPEHQEHIVRQYLQATNFGGGDQELIEDQIAEWLESGTIAKKAGQFKPKLDQMEEAVVQQKLAQQEQVRQQQIKQKEAYMENIYNTLKPAELNGVKVDSKRQNFLWNELTTVKYESMTGRPTNLLGKLLEDYQFGEKPRYDLIAETLWLLSDPDDYKEAIRKQAKNEVTQDTVKKLKTEEQRKLSSNQINDDSDDEPTPRKKLNRPKNIFSGR